ncbi:MAG: hypothetical protein KKF98_12875 [Bacteroidetes bacterium]|nr:hypothetical protein [Bacteroidota bacterium]
MYKPKKVPEVFAIQIQIIFTFTFSKPQTVIGTYDSIPSIHTPERTRAFGLMKMPKYVFD